MKILVIDPSSHFLQAMRNFINAQPRCECVAAASLDEALGLDRDLPQILVGLAPEPEKECA